MTPKQIAKQCYNQRDYALNGMARRETSRQYYYQNRERVLAQKKTARERILGVAP